MSILSKQDFLIHMRSLREFLFNLSALQGMVNTSYTDDFVDKHVKLLEYSMNDDYGRIGDFVFETLVEDMTDDKFEELYQKLF